jgi:cytidylate kinase
MTDEDGLSSVTPNNDNSFDMDANFVFCGPLGSGKTEVSKTVAAKTGSRWTSFGATLKRIAAERTIPIDREHLQALGEELVSRMPEAFCHRVLDEAEPQGQQHIVVDGLRHAEIFPILQRLSQPRRLVCIFVDVTNQVRLERIKLRDHATESQIAKWESHSTEIEVQLSVRRLADCVVDNSDEVETTVEKVLLWIKDISAVKH